MELFRGQGAHWRRKAKKKKKKGTRVSVFSLSISNLPLQSELELDFFCSSLYFHPSGTHCSQAVDTRGKIMAYQRGKNTQLFWCYFELWSSTFSILWGVRQLLHAFCLGFIAVLSGKDWMECDYSCCLEPELVSCNLLENSVSIFMFIFPTSN